MCPLCIGERMLLYEEWIMVERSTNDSNES